MDRMQASIFCASFRAGMITENVVAGDDTVEEKILSLLNQYK